MSTSDPLDAATKWTRDSENLPGLDLERLAHWSAEHVPGWATGGFEAARIPGGRSNLTYFVRSGDTEYVLRRPPVGSVLATAHDMRREFRVAAALAPTPVPVPATVAFCDDPEVLGAEFYVMQRVRGTSYQWKEQLNELGPDRARTISTRLISTLVALHQVDPTHVGLDRLGRPEGFLTRQVDRWMRQLSAARTRDLPDVDRLHRRLVEITPSTRRVGVVHGDYRLDNVLFDDGDQAAAVIDWEMATIGDPFTDLALAVVYQRAGEMPGGGGIATASSAEGFLSEDDLIAAYVSESGSDIPDLGFYLGLATFKLAGILEGIRHRRLNGHATGVEAENPDHSTEQLLAAGIASLRRTD